jgi:hypothetical protein
MIAYESALCMKTSIKFGAGIMITKFKWSIYQINNSVTIILII